MLAEINVVSVMERVSSNYPNSIPVGSTLEDIDLYCNQIIIVLFLFLFLSIAILLSILDSCLGCDMVPFSDKTIDQCQVCGGDNSCLADQKKPKDVCIPITRQFIYIYRYIDTC